MHRQPIATAAQFYAYQSHPHYHDPALGSLAYRPLQLPLQQFPPAADQQELSLAAGSALREQSFRHHQLAHRPREQTSQARVMASPFHQQGTTEEELTELQKLSNEYEPEATGPLVGQRQPSTAITTEYSSADPVFQAKTAALPQKYSSYRTVRGDGRCGWRAIAFGYFETLVHFGESTKFLEEETRLRSLHNVLNAAGFDSLLYEDFADETFDLLRKVTQAAQAGNAEDVILEAFNDETIQNYIMTHLKTLTAAWMKTRPQEYAPWLLGQTVEEYCNASVLPIGSEIDNVGLSALKDVLLSPAGITLEVLYLDRSEGSEVNMHRFSPADGFDIGTIRLLYRPGHYDLLYMPQDLPPVSLPGTVPSYLQYASQHHDEPVYPLGVSDFMTMIPGMSFTNNPHHGYLSSSSYTGSDFFATPAPVQPCPQAIPISSAPVPLPQMQHQQVGVPTATSPLVPPPTQIPQEHLVRSLSHGSIPQYNGLQHQIGGPFRPSAWELEPDFVQSTSQTAFQTSIFKNSHFNTAHFMNPDFQPEEWHPYDDYMTTTSSGRSSRHRNSG